MSKLIGTGKWWWAYLDDTGVVRVKPYTGDKIIQNTEQLPFCRGIFDPFTADNLKHAQTKIAEFLTHQQVEEAKKDSFTKQFMEAPEQVQ
jgi:hypothetical protein